MNKRDLFIAALQIDDPAGRTAYLDKACGDDAELSQRVGSLLVAFEKTGSSLQKPETRRRFSPRQWSRPRSCWGLW